MNVKITALSTVIAATLAAPALAAEDGAYKVADKPIKLDIHLHQKKFVYNNDWPVEKEAARLTNVQLNNVASMATTKSEEAFNLLIASGDLPDIVGGSSMKNNVNTYGPEGAFVPLNKLIEEHAPNIKAFFDANPDVWASIKASDGNVYYIPYLPDGKYGRGYFVRYDWLNKLGLEPPQNVDEMYEVLKAFRDKDPNGNGKKDEVPFFARHWQEMIRLVTLWDGRTSGSDVFHDFHVVDGKIKHGYAGENYKEGIKNLAKWYDEGLIDAEVFTRGSRSREYLLSADLGGMTHDWFASTSGYNDSLADKVEGFEFKAFAPPASVSGQRVEEHRRAKVKPDGWAISYTNEHPIETIQYFDFWFTQDGKRLANFGIEGEHYEVVDGKPTFTQAVLEADTPVNAQMWAIGAQVQRGFPMDYQNEVQWSNKYALEGIALYDQGDYLLEPFMGVSLSAREKDVYDKHWVTIRDYMVEMQQAWILGSRDVEKDWPKYQKSIERMGYSKVVSAMQTAYDRAYKAK
ncbi:extracellular solute-binding protein [Vibrio methylphosphonaticus]|uniref:extracellular solute-binding protein n=1 Tax=Vibrio methylphosphonaticus TaxID=2946866 RepID=UPI00202A6BCA|nr:extracellular solute-binding protein [Vibrio methylphosphonaticus]MCL9774430.1 extracellular solute-binding protein [Vibrio methylphosphonaticus]